MLRMKGKNIKRFNYQLRFMESSGTGNNITVQNNDIKLENIDIKLENNNCKHKIKNFCST